LTDRARFGAHARRERDAETINLARRNNAESHTAPSIWRIEYHLIGGHECPVYPRVVDDADGGLRGVRPVLTPMIAHAVGEAWGLDLGRADELGGSTALNLVAATDHVRVVVRVHRPHVTASRVEALIPAAIAIPALATLALVTAVCVLVVAYEAIRHSADRVRLRHPELS
jgi:hypothetical protein